MSTIYRADLTTLWITLQASEELGLLTSDYLQDFYGNDGQVSLYHVPTTTYYPLVMAAMPLDTPEIPHDVFKGPHALATLPDGAYEIRGRCRDVIGNYTLLNSVQNPLGGERIVTLTFTLKPGRGLIYQVPIGGALVRVGLAASALQRPAIIPEQLTRQTVVGSTLSRPDLVA